MTLLLWFYFFPHVSDPFQSGAVSDIVFNITTSGANIMVKCNCAEEAQRNGVGVVIPCFIAQVAIGVNLLPAALGAYSLFQLSSSLAGS